jgi:hypothetical protein
MPRRGPKVEDIMVQITTRATDYILAHGGHVTLYAKLLSG